MSNSPAHWYCLVYAQGTDTHSLYVDVQYKYITRSLIDRGKSEVGFEKDCMLLSCSYLGCT